VSPPKQPPLVRLAALQSIVCDQVRGLLGYPRSASTSPLPAHPRGFPPVAVPCNFRCRFILSCALPPLQSLTSFRPPLASRLGAPSLGFLAPIAVSAGGVLDAGFPRPAPFRPRRFARPRRLPPPPTLRAYFIPLPRPGFALQGFSLAHSRTSSSLAVALLSLPSVPYPRLLAGSRYLSPPSGPCSVSESVVRRSCLGRDPPAALLSFPFLGFFFVRLEGDFAPSPPTAFPGPRCVSAPDLTRSCELVFPVQGSLPADQLLRVCLRGPLSRI